ncbi:type III secretion system inner membrane ring lipoprotein SctJ [Roseiconus lacunae]|uniref:type III secretion system inner membrane ring lipoprotein SctJ n=1 Tax=Roseiconus lacunae TaxID=2605694 RepID=UPI001E2AFA4A|nr:type III secretion inner membrane ring lipoprotein SctJ [Roseiconus lacunae]MCD0457876.1 type III secretion inner membrane ring lipoprotein SctJ [Roseiconus lacunae]
MAVTIVLFVGGCAKVDLYCNLQEREANEMMAILLERGIQCDKQSGEEEFTWDLLVASDDFSQAVAILRPSGYPNDQHPSIGDVFQKSGFISSPTEDRIRYVYALSEEIAETISRIDGVVDARVHVVLPENDPFSEKVTPSSASVYLKHRADVDLSSELTQIKDLVAKSIESLESNNIEVFLDEVAPLSAPTTPENSYFHALGLKIGSKSVGKFWAIIGGLVLATVAGFAGTVSGQFGFKIPGIASKSQASESKPTKSNHPQAVKP